MGRKLSMIMAAMAGTARFDADESAVVARELESIERIVTQTLYPELKSLQFVPLIPGIDEGAQVYTWKRQDLRGTAKVVSNRGQDLPRVDVDISENYVPIRVVADKFDYTTDELRAFALAKAKGSSISLDQARADTARLMIERKIDSMVAVGDTDTTGLTGMINASTVPLVTPVVGGWATATPQQILADIQKLERAIITQSYEMLPADTLLLPIDQWARLAMPLGTNNDHSIMQYVLNNALSIKTIQPWFRLSGAGAGATDRAVAYKRVNTVVGALVPMLFRAQPPQARDLGFDIPCEAKCGGAVWRQPLGGAYMDGI